jgi:hypothetical protein
MLSATRRLGDLPDPWFSASDLAAARRRLAAGDPHTVRLASLARADASDPAAERHLAGCCVVVCLDADPQAATRAFDHLMAQPIPPQDLGLAHRGMQLALAMACCRPVWSSAQRTAIAAEADAVVGRLRHTLSSHNPHSVQNNWWGVTHAGAFMAAWAAHGVAGDRSEELLWALGRILAFSQHFGSAGLYHEGLGYQMYTLSHLLPALVAAGRLGLADLSEACPWLPRLAESLFIATSPRPAISDSAAGSDGHGMILSWNDAGLAWGACNVTPLMLSAADPARVGALRWWSQRLDGHLVPGGTLAAGWHGWIFDLFHHPFAAEAVPAQGVLRRHVTDHRQGLAVFRDRWRDGEDAVLGCYARTTHIGGHSQDDGGSVRFMALGHDWIIGGGQARGAGRWQSIVMPATAEGATERKAGLGAVIWDEETADGGVFGMDLRRVSDAYHERYVAMAGNGSTGVPVALAMLDLVDDHLDRDWVWRITCMPSMEIAIDPDQAGFSLRAADGAIAQVRFLGQLPATMRLERTPDSKRTFSGGETVAYPGRPVVAATFARRTHLAIHAVMTVGRGTPVAAQAGSGVDVSIGGRLWARPYSLAVPADYDLVGAGTLSRWPDGLRGSP